MISVVIGSWGSYNECNERALGSKWLDLSNFDDWSEIEEELTKQGRISLIAYPLLEDENGLYFEYGPFYKKIYIDDFEEVND